MWKMWAIIKIITKAKTKMRIIDKIKQITTGNKTEIWIKTKSIKIVDKKIKK